MNKIKNIIIDSGVTRYSINKATGVELKTMDRWFAGESAPSITLLKVLNHISKNDEELLTNIKNLLDE